MLDFVLLCIYTYVHGKSGKITTLTIWHDVLFYLNDSDVLKNGNLLALALFVPPRKT